MMIFDKFSNQLLILLHAVPILRRIQTILPTPAISIPKLIVTHTEGNIIFSHVAYTNTHGRPILKDINLTIARGEFIGITGASGSGKTTLFRLLLSLDPLTAGRICLDNMNIQHLDGHSLRKQFGVVLQSSNVFPGSIFANLAIHKTLTLAEAWQLAEKVGLADDIERMPMKMHTIISDNASESLSGGQKQKILLARALATQPRILLLDEATSALDAASQAKIFNYLNTLSITRLVISHNPKTLISANKIYSLERGILR